MQKHRLSVVRPCLAYDSYRDLFLFYIALSVRSISTDVLNCRHLSGCRLLLFVLLLQVGFRESADGDDAKFEAGFKEGFKRALIHGLEWGRQRGQSMFV